MWALALVKMEGGVPEIDPGITPYHSHLLLGHAGGWGAYLFSGTGPQLTALNALPEVVGICSMTHIGEGVKWAELDNTIGSAIRAKLNTWLTNRGLPIIPSDWTNRQVVKAIVQRMNSEFDIDREWVTEQ